MFKKNASDIEILAESGTDVTAISSSSPPSSLKMHNNVSEKEISFKLELPNLVYNNLMCYFEQLQYKTITKLNYSSPKGFRVIFGNDYTKKQIKTQQEKREDFLYYKNKFIFKTVIKKSIEETMPIINNIEDDNNLESSIQRHYVYNNNTTRKLRLGIEKKFASKYTNSPPDSNIVNGSVVLALDKWVRLASQTFLHVEYEYDGDTDEAILQLQNELESSKIFEDIMHYIITVCNNASLSSLIENKLDAFSRDFATTLTEKPLYVAWKLDGIRKSCIIHQNVLMIDGIKTIDLGIQIPQPIKCHVEMIGDVYYIIDILEIWGPKNVYIKPDHLQSIKIIQSTFIQQIITSSVATNKYFSPGRVLPPTDIKNDGLLMYTSKQIIKNKEHTVDLILIKPSLKHKKKVKKCKFGYYMKNGGNSSVGSSDKELHHDRCIEDLLLFADKTTFASVFPGWVVDLNSAANNNNNPSTMEFINEIFEEGLSPDNKLSICNFTVLEFKLDYKNKKIKFLKKRSDKMQANTSQAMYKMFDY